MTPNFANNKTLKFKKNGLDNKNRENLAKYFNVQANKDSFGGTLTVGLLCFLDQGYGLFGQTKIITPDVSFSLLGVLYSFPDLDVDALL